MMAMKICPHVVLAVIVGLCDGCTIEQAQVAELSCGAERAQQAEQVAASAQSWRQLHDMFSRFATCDDGAIAEGFSESVTVLLAEKWDQLPELSSIAASDSTFETFVVRHIDESAPQERLSRIAALASQQCRPDFVALCQRIRSQIPTKR
jgi:hypothetical protein